MPPHFADVEAALAATSDARSRAVDFDALSDQFEVLTRRLLDARSVGAALQQVVDAAKSVVPSADLVSVTLRGPDGTVFTPVLTADLAMELDRIQYQTGEGPCLDSADPKGPAFSISHSLATETRWPEFSAAAASHGYRAVLSTEVLPAACPDQLTGALNIYSRGCDGLSDNDRHTALLLATHAALALAHARTTELADLHTTQLTKAVDSRDVIGQAKGILMQRQGITADQAFALLRGISQDLNVKVVEIARNLVSRHAELDP